MANSTYIALLRGINVGGRNKLPMATLRSIFAGLGCQSVRTYIQSGNVIFEAGAGIAKTIAREVSKRIDDEMSLRIPVVIRSAAELAKAVASHPLAKSGAPETVISVMFLADKPTAACIKSLDPDRSPGDSFKVIGREIYLYCPNGAAGSKLTNAYFDRALKTVSTTRNWRTCQKLLEMVS